MGNKKRKIDSKRLQNGDITLYMITNYKRKNEKRIVNFLEKYKRKNQEK